MNLFVNSQLQKRKIKVFDFKRKSFLAIVNRLNVSSEIEATLVEIGYFWAGNMCL